MKTDSNPNHRKPRSIFVTFTLSILLGSCASYGPYHANTAAEPTKSVRGPSDGRYKFAFIEFGDQGSALDTSPSGCHQRDSPGAASPSFRLHPRLAKQCQLR